MEENILVTVILTVYKRTEYLETALKSVLNQTMDKFEVIIADDSGCRIAESIYKNYEEDKRISYQFNLATLGIVNSLKTAIKRSKGAFISILNDDDFWEKTFLKKLSDALVANTDCVLAFSDHWIVDANDKKDIASTNANTIQYKRDQINTGIIANPKKIAVIDNGIPLAMASIFKKESIDFNLLVPEVSGAYDYWLSCLFASTDKPFYYENERLTNYRVHNQMETARRSTDKGLDTIYILRTLLSTNLFPDYKELIAEKCSFYLYKIGVNQLHFKQFTAARLYFKQALKTKMGFKPILFLGLSFLPSFLLKKLLS